MWCHSPTRTNNYQIYLEGSDQAHSYYCRMPRWKGNVHCLSQCFFFCWNAEYTKECATSLPSSFVDTLFNWEGKPRLVHNMPSRMTGRANRVTIIVQLHHPNWLVLCCSFETILFATSYATQGSVRGVGVGSMQFRNSPDVPEFIENKRIIFVILQENWLAHSIAMLTITTSGSLPIPRALAIFVISVEELPAIMISVKDNHKSQAYKATPMDFFLWQEDYSISNRCTRPLTNGRVSAKLGQQWVVGV
jgi:hypothetical protein